MNSPQLQLHSNSSGNLRGFGCFSVLLTCFSHQALVVWVGLSPLLTCFSHLALAWAVLAFCQHVLAVQHLRFGWFSVLLAYFSHLALAFGLFQHVLAIRHLRFGLVQRLVACFSRLALAFCAGLAVLAFCQHVLVIQHSLQRRTLATFKLFQLF